VICALWNAVAPLELVEYIIGELSVVRGAPVSLGLSVLAVGLLLFYLMTWGYGRTVTCGCSSTTTKEKLKGATPQEARDRIDALEATANLTIGQSLVAHILRARKMAIAYCH
jgi:hypothetical protein